MQYSQAQLGRIFVLKFEHQDDILEELKKFCQKTKLKTAFFSLIGGLQKGRIVSGPKKAVIPPDPNWVPVKDGWEMLGVGTIFPDAETGIGIHLHTALGKGLVSRTGCLRQDGKIFIVAEAMVYELKGIKAIKKMDPAKGIKLLQLG